MQSPTVLLFSLSSLSAVAVHRHWSNAAPAAAWAPPKESSAFQSELRMPDSALRHQNASPADKGKVTICDGKPGDEDRPKKSSVCKSIEGCQEELLAQVVSLHVVQLFSFPAAQTCWLLLHRAGVHGMLSFTDGVVDCSGHTGNAHVPHGGHPNKLPAGVGSGKQQPCSASPQRTAHPGQNC